MAVYRAKGISPVFGLKCILFDIPRPTLAVAKEYPILRLYSAHQCTMAPVGSIGSMAPGAPKVRSRPVNQLPAALKEKGDLEHRLELVQQEKLDVERKLASVRDENLHLQTQLDQMKVEKSTLLEHLMKDKHQRKELQQESSLLIKELQGLRQRAYKSVEEGSRLKVELKSLEEELRILRLQHQEEEQNQRCWEQKVEIGRQQRDSQRVALQNLLQENRLKQSEAGTLEGERQLLMAQVGEALQEKRNLEQKIGRGNASQAALHSRVAVLQHEIKKLQRCDKGAEQASQSLAAELMKLQASKKILFSRLQDTNKNLAFTRNEFLKQSLSRDFNPDTRTEDHQKQTHPHSGLQKAEGRRTSSNAGERCETGEMGKRHDNEESSPKDSSDTSSSERNEDLSMHERNVEDLSVDEGEGEQLHLENGETEDLGIFDDGSDDLKFDADKEDLGIFDDAEKDQTLNDGDAQDLGIFDDDLEDLNLEEQDAEDLGIFDDDAQDLNLEELDAEDLGIFDDNVEDLNLEEEDMEHLGDAADPTLNQGGAVHDDAEEDLGIFDTEDLRLTADGDAAAEDALLDEGETDEQTG